MTNAYIIDAIRSPRGRGQRLLEQVNGVWHWEGKPIRSRELER